MPDNAIVAVALGRIGFGFGLLLAPQRAGRGLFGDAVDAPRGRLLVRAIGARDIVIGGGALWALQERQPVRRWLFASLAADATDIVLAAVAFGQRPSPARLAAFAMTAAALMRPAPRPDADDELAFFDESQTRPIAF